MGAMTAVEKDRIAKRIFGDLCRREHYAKEGDGQWVTIGGGPGAGGEKHSGGTPVKIGPTGHIAAGPDNLEGQHIDAVDKNKGAGDRPAWHGFRDEAEAAEKAGDTSKAARRWKDAAGNHPGGPGHPEVAAMLERAAGKPATLPPLAPPSQPAAGDPPPWIAERDALQDKADYLVAENPDATPEDLQRALNVPRDRAIKMLKGAGGNKAGEYSLTAQPAAPAATPVKSKLNLTPEQRAKIDGAIAKQAAVPGAPAVGGPAVDAAKHASVKAAVGDSAALVAYYHDGAYYFLHDDAAPAAKVLDSTAVTHDGLKEALGKLIGAGHRVAIAEPADQPAPRQKPQRKPKPTPEARPPLDSPELRGSIGPDATNQGDAIPPEASPAGGPSGSAGKVANPEPAAGQSKSPQTPERPADASGSTATKRPRKGVKVAEKASQASGDPQKAPEFALKGGKALQALPKPRQISLFDKLKSDPDSPEAKAVAQAAPTAAAIARGTGTHRLANQHGEQPPPGVTVGEDGIWSGTATLHAADIQADPKRFQYKISGIGEKGVTKELADVRQYNPMFGGQLLVWRDPENGKTFVINGHHRHELASRSQPFTDPTTGLSWNGEMQSYYIPAKSPEQARAWGAVANMAEGRGTATDAAKFMRDSGATIDDLKRHGISLRGKVAADALHLKDLSPRGFQALGEGRMTEGRALAIARDLKDPELQDKLIARIEKRERETEKQIPDSHIVEMSKEYNLAGKARVDGGGGGVLFGGDEQESLIEERAALKANLRGALASERNIFKSVSSARRVGKIQEGGKNTLDVEGNKERASEAASALYLFDRLANSKGALSDAINQAAEQLRASPRQRKQIDATLRKQALDIIRTEWGSGGQSEQPEPEQYSAQSGRVGGSARGRGEAAAAGGARTDDILAGSERAGFRERLAAVIRPAVERYSAELESAIETGGHKRSKVEANYRHGFSNARCGSCAHFHGDRCQLVDGPVEANAVCDLYTQEREADEHAGIGPVSEPERYQLALDIRRGLQKHCSAI